MQILNHRASLRPNVWRLIGSAHAVTPIIGQLSPLRLGLQPLHLVGIKIFILGANGAICEP